MEQPRAEEELAQQVADGLTLQMERMNQPPATVVVSKKSAAEEPSDATTTQSLGVEELSW